MPIRRLFPKTPLRFFSTAPSGFIYHKHFLNRQEQLLLTEAALAHLDNVGPSATRRKQKRLLASGSIVRDEDGFLPEACYEFEEVTVFFFGGITSGYGILTRSCRVISTE